MLNFLIGFVCILFGLLLVWAFLNGVHERVGLSPSFAIPARIIIFGTPIYGALAVIGAVGMWGRSARLWWLAVAVDLVGLAFLVWAVSIGLDSGAPLRDLGRSPGAPRRLVDPDRATRLGRRHRLVRNGCRRRRTDRDERLANLGREAGRVEPEHPSQVGDGAVIDEPVARDADDPDARRRAARRPSGGPPRSPRGRRDPNPPVSTLSSNVTTSRLPRAWSRISSRSSGFAKRALITPIDQPSAVERVGGLEGARDDRAEPDEQQVTPLAQDLAAPDREQLGFDRRQAEARVARVVERERVVLGERGPERAIGAPARPSGDAMTRFGSCRWAGIVNMPWWLVPSSPTSPARSTASSTGWSFWQTS